MNVLPYVDDGLANQSNSVWDLLRVVFVLALIVGLIVLLLRFFAKRNRGWWMNRSLRSLGGLPLGTNKSMQIVEWNGRIYVLGVGENVTLLEAVTDSDMVAALLADFDTEAASTNPVLPEWLRKWAQRRNTQGGEEGGGVMDTQPSFQQTLELRLRGLAERRQRVEQLLEERPSGDRSDKS
jgi:flagellar protein FliO/FliZ